MAADSESVFSKNAPKIFISFGEVCRFCLSETQNDIFLNDKCLPEESNEVERDTIYNFVTKWKIVKMNDAETFPSLVCENCYEVIKICHSFFKVCENSENLLNECLERAVKEKLNFSNDASAEFPDENLTVINIEPCHFNNEDNSKKQQTEQSFLVSGVKALSENVKSNDFRDFINSENENYRCCLCSLKFSNPEALNLHHIYTHKTTEEEFRENVTHMKNSQVNVKDLCCFDCIPCRKFQTRDDLIKHLKSHEVNHHYNCSYCEKKFSLKLSLNRHLLDVHNFRTEDVKILKQELVDSYDFMNSITDFLNFYKDRGKNFKVFCKSCNPSVSFPTRDDYISHMVLYHSSVKFTENVESKVNVKNNSNWKCSDCPAAYTQKRLLFCHTREKHDAQRSRSYKCPVCSETFPTNRKLIRHGITAHQKYFASFHKVYERIIHPSREPITPSKNFECELCQKRYMFKTSLKKHIFTVHLRETKDFVACPYCGKTLANKLNLKSHIEFKHEALFVSCPICKKRINFRTIGRHYKVHQNSEADAKNSFLCNQCGRVLKSKRSFEDHQKIHKNARNELCDICGNGYASKKALRSHKKTHEGAQIRKTHECDQCEKVFSGRHTLNRHLLTHSGVKNFICEICSKCFYTLQELNRHVRYHKKEYRFECQQCDMRFVDRSRFRHHLMKHKNIRPYKCQFCEKMFIVRGKLNLHMASKHNAQVDSQRVWKDPKAYIPLDELL